MSKAPRTRARTWLIVLFATVGTAWAIAARVETRVVVVIPDGTRVLAEVVDSPEERRVGLSRHSFLEPNRAMLFLLDAPSVPTFWMKDMDFPIDILWISGDEIVDIDRDVPVPTDTEVGNDALPTYAPERPVDRVLELNAGFAAAHGIHVGDQVEIR